jgi:hypothetical protein
LTEINEFDFILFGYHDVLRLEISVHVASTFQVFQRLKDLVENKLLIELVILLLNLARAIPFSSYVRQESPLNTQKQ